MTAPHPPGALPSRSTPPPTTLPEHLLHALHRLGVRQAFGLVGGAIAPLCDALGRAPITAWQLRHEAGALFAAVEASLASGRTTLAFVTTGPGVLNALNGAMAARWEGARVILLSGATSPAQRGRWAVQESGPATLPAEAIYAPGAIFHDAMLVDHPAQLAEALARIEAGLAGPGGFVAHYALSIAVQRTRGPIPAGPARPAAPDPDPVTPAEVQRAAVALSSAPFAIWIGHGARDAVAAIRTLVDRTGAPVICTPRAKGILPESHPAFVGVTGCGGHEHVDATLARLGIRRTLVLGTRLGEFSTCWSPGLVPPDGLVHVDVDPTAFGAAYPDAPTIGIRSTVRELVQALLPHLPAGAVSSGLRPPPTPPPPSRGRILPQELLAAVQERVMEGSDAPVLAESGNAFLWANGLLRPEAPGRYRVSGLWGSMGHATSGIVGLAAVRGKAVALVGDGAMLMMNEVSSAVQYRLPAAWIVLNDARMGIVEKGMIGLGLRPFETDLPPTDFAALAVAMGATGERVTRADELRPALDRLLAAPGPHVLDVLIDPDEPSPFARRVSTLQAMGARAPEAP